MNPQQIDDFVALHPNPEALRTWAASLRSGAFTQGSGHISMTPNNGTCLCVLGVGLATLRREDWLAGNAEYLAALEMMGLDPDLNPKVGDTPVHVALFDLNDEHHWTFEQFADLFETVAERVS